jgi:quercetin dioxygenase-like cupin family protein
MPFLNIAELATVEKRPGWRGRFFHSVSMTVGHWEFDAGARVHAHAHPNEEKSSKASLR